MTSKTKQTTKVGKTSLVHSSWSQTITFVNHEGVERRIDDRAVEGRTKGRATAIECR